MSKTEKVYFHPAESVHLLYNGDENTIIDTLDYINWLEGSLHISAEVGAKAFYEAQKYKEEDSL